MRKKKFSLDSNLVKVTSNDDELTYKKEKSIYKYTGPNSGRVHFSTSINPDIKNRFKVWVAMQGSNMSTEIEKALLNLMNINK